MQADWVIKGKGMARDSRGTGTTPHSATFAVAPRQAGGDRDPTRGTRIGEDQGMDPERGDTGSRTTTGEPSGMMTRSRTTAGGNRGVAVINGATTENLEEPHEDDTDIGHLIIQSFNTCGLRRRLEDPVFMESIKQYHLTLLSETHLDNGDNEFVSEKLSEYNLGVKFKNRRALATHRSGGVMYYL